MDGNTDGDPLRGRGQRAAAETEAADTLLSFFAPGRPDEEDTAAAAYGLMGIWPQAVEQGFFVPRRRLPLDSVAGSAPSAEPAAMQMGAMALPAPPRRRGRARRSTPVPDPAPMMTGNRVPPPMASPFARAPAAPPSSGASASGSSTSSRRRRPWTVVSPREHLRRRPSRRTPAPEPAPTTPGYEAPSPSTAARTRPPRSRPAARPTPMGSGSMPPPPRPFPHSAPSTSDPPLESWGWLYNKPFACAGPRCSGRGCSHCALVTLILVRRIPGRPGWFGFPGLEFFFGNAFTTPDLSSLRERGRELFEQGRTVPGYLLEGVGADEEMEEVWREDDRRVWVRRAG